MLNNVKREIPKTIPGFGDVIPFKGVWQHMPMIHTAPVSLVPSGKGTVKKLHSIEQALDACELKDGMTVSFHHHLRNGDGVLNQVMEAIDARGLKDIHVAASSLFPVHAPLVSLMEKGTVTRITANYMLGPVAEAISNGKLTYPVVMQTHGGRARAIEVGDLSVDVAFIAAPACDLAGNLNGVEGPSACGSLGYAVPDAHYAKRVVAVTDHLVPYPANPIEISQEWVDFIVEVDSIGDPEGIVSGSTRLTRDPLGLNIARKAAQAIEASGLLVDGFSFQTGAGGVSLAVAAYVREIMRQKKIKGSFASGGITGYMVDMLEEGLFRSLLDVQCFDLQAVNSYKQNPAHQFMSASMYGNPHNRGAVVNQLDVMILGATEIDTDFNVNVTTGSTGIIMGGSGGHSDTAAGSKLAIVTTQLLRGRLPIIRDKVTTVTTPGESVDLLVTERGIAVNPRRKDLEEKLNEAGIPTTSIHQLKQMAEERAGTPDPVAFEERIVGVVEYRDGTVIDVIRQQKQHFK
ncbi:citrate lyase subunit alpha [Anoxynatronum buryatiense]|uniref:Citrate lyase alpha chain n=1 Tax=Anoxynatronum buryatiense TaxID=489973 RepID=A0AA45WWS1_9CLOT|nr:citrate lyase subunit alpha [Anoxynatronum buryatiense]SMP60491.1 citrate lyase subunit alpha / citrate CoA-transferase [Anoxynatronum buryatiense]